MTNEWHVQRHLWRDHAACIGKPTRWFYAAERWPELSAQALKTCAGCSVRMGCLDDALDFEVGDRVTLGVRGGFWPANGSSSRFGGWVGVVVVVAVEREPAMSSGIRLHEAFAAAI